MQLLHPSKKRLIGGTSNSKVTTYKTNANVYKIIKSGMSFSVEMNGVHLIDDIPKIDALKTVKFLIEKESKPVTITEMLLVIKYNRNKLNWEFTPSTLCEYFVNMLQYSID